MNQRPNILLITSDQHRGDTLGCAGHPCVRTPHLDRLAYQGIRFENAYSDCPVCIPARTTLITGVKSSTYGAPGYQEHFRFEREREKYLGSLLTGAGYQTALVGKRHWHTDPSFKAGFETVISIDRCKREQNQWYQKGGQPHGLAPNEFNPGRTPYPPELYSTDWVASHSVEWLRELENDRPFFLWTSFVDPHPPLAIHEPFYSMYDQSPVPPAVCGDWVQSDDCPVEQVQHRLAYNPGPCGEDELRKARGVYYGMVTNIDHQLGRIFGTLMRKGLWENTLVIYTSDHGDLLGDHLDMAKSSFYNASANIPMIMAPPLSWGTEPGRVSPAMVELADLLPTLAGVGGAEVPGDVEGQDLQPLLKGEVRSVRERLYGQVDGRHMVRSDQWKFLYHTRDGAEQLFATDDQDDLHNVAADRPEICDELRAQLKERLRSVSHPDLVDGELRNDGATLPPLNELRSHNAAGWVVTGRTLEFEGPF